jgi:hypothetical protein
MFEELSKCPLRRSRPGQESWFRQPPWLAAAQREAAEKQACSRQQHQRKGDLRYYRLACHLDLERQNHADSRIGATTVRE